MSAGLIKRLGRWVEGLLVSRSPRAGHAPGPCADTPPASSSATPSAPGHPVPGSTATDQDAVEYDEPSTVEPSNSRSLDNWGPGPLRRFVAYGNKVYGLRKLFAGVRDGRRKPTHRAPLVATAVFFCGLLRIRSFNALEPKLKERTFGRLLGAPAAPEGLGSADTISRALKRTDLETVRGISDGIIAKAERNKVFREGWHGTLRYAAIDGWEPISSYHRHCPHCLVRLVKKKNATGEVVEVEQYYHRYVVAMLIDERFDLVLDIEPVLPADLRPGPLRGDSHEGELTAAKRLVARVKKKFSWIDAVVADALYANGPFLTLLHELKLGGVIIAKKEDNEPLKDALLIWDGQLSANVVEDVPTGEKIALWDCPDVETLETYKGKIRVVRARITKRGQDSSSTWCMLVVGKPTRLTPLQVLKVARGRWHIENTGFHQWTTRWKFAHVFTHDGPGLMALYWLFFAAFNLLTLFLYRQLRSYGRDRGKDVTRTISRLIDEMRDDLARLATSPWDPG